jgi:hypothetical protein
MGFCFRDNKCALKLSPFMIWILVTTHIYIYNYHSKHIDLSTIGNEWTSHNYTTSPMTLDDFDFDYTSAGYFWQGRATIGTQSDASTTSDVTTPDTTGDTTTTAVPVLGSASSTGPSACVSAYSILVIICTRIRGTQDASWWSGVVR